LTLAALLLGAPAHASTLFAFTCDFDPPPEDGGRITVELYADEPVGLLTITAYPESSRGVKWTELNQTTAIVDDETGQLLMLFDGQSAKIPYGHEWMLGTCRGGAE
jgi:hypothetical protein